MPAAKTENRAGADSVLVIRRTFDAPRELVWKTWTEVEHAKQWWGPKGFTAPVVEREIRFDINSSTFVSRDTLRGSASRQPTRIPVSDLQQVWVESTNVKRTTVTVVVVGALLVGFVALAVSQMEFGL